MMRLLALLSRYLRENLVAMAFLFLGVAAGTYLLREKVVEACHIPTPSMEPTLMGDEEQGDRVFVNKLAFVLGEPRRFQMAVFLRDGEEVNYIKRIVGMPGESLVIRNGDVHVDGAILRKPDWVTRELSVPVYRSGGSFAEFGTWWQVAEGGTCGKGRRGMLLEPGPEGRGALVLKGEVLDSYVDERGLVRGANPVGDLRLTLEWEADAAAVLRVGMAEERDRLEWRLGPEGVNGSVNGRTVFTHPPLGPAGKGRRGPLVFCNYDDRMTLDGPGLHLSADYLGSEAGDQGRSNGLRIEFEGGAALLLRLDLHRDIYYTPTGRNGVSQVFRVPEDSYFLLGDNSPDSRDSRSWGAVERGHLVGAPFMIFWPPRRFRLL